MILVRALLVSFLLVLRFLVVLGMVTTVSTREIVDFPAKRNFKIAR